MSQEIEIEFKNMLTKEEFLFLKKKLNLTAHDFVTQHNDYFDTDHFTLKDQRSALRIREKAGHFVFTLKQPHKIGLLETHQPLSYEQVQTFFLSKTLPDGEVVSKLRALSIPLSSLRHLGRLTTERAELALPEGHLALDHSSYFDQEDYELELETADFERGQAHFSKLLNDWGLPVRKAENKLFRFFTYKTTNNL